MKTMDITLPDELQVFAQTEAIRRGFSNPGEFMQSLLEAEISPGSGIASLGSCRWSVF